MTEALGDSVTFKNRTLTFTFSLLNAHIYWTSVLSSISNYLHGQKMQIIMDADKTFYYYGRCKVNEFKSSKTLGTIVVECDVEPYKIEVNGAGTAWIWDTFSFVDGIIYETSYTVSGSLEVNLINRAKIVSPTFICNADMTVTYNGITYSIPTGTTTVYDIRLQEGDNYMTLTGTGTVSVTYKGGSL